MIYLFKNKEQRITALIACAIILEMSINGLSVVFNMKYQNRSEYTNFISTYGSIVDKIKENDNSFYRLEKDYSYSTNDAPDAIILYTILLLYINISITTLKNIVYGINFLNKPLSTFLMLK